jgi:hypothetical protein
MAFSMLLRLQIVENLQHIKGIRWAQECSTLLHKYLSQREGSFYREREQGVEIKKTVLRVCM